MPDLDALPGEMMPAEPVLQRLENTIHLVRQDRDDLPADLDRMRRRVAEQERGELVPPRCDHRCYLVPARTSSERDLEREADRPGDDMRDLLHELVQHLDAPSGQVMHRLIQRLTTQLVDEQPRF